MNVILLLLFISTYGDRQLNNPRIIISCMELLVHDICCYWSLRSNWTVYMKGQITIGLPRNRKKATLSRVQMSTTECPSEITTLWNHQDLRSIRHHHPGRQTTLPTILCLLQYKIIIEVNVSRMVDIKILN